MKFTVAGVGPGDPDLVTIRALKTIACADLVLVPHSRGDKPSIAEEIVRANLSDIKTTAVVLPMTNDAEERDSSLNEQLETLRPLWENAGSVVLPVIGDASLYATGSYLYDVWKKLVPELELELLPGISAYSLAASRSENFLAMRDEILTIIPGTNSLENIEKALMAADSAAIYKPCALGDNLSKAVTETGPWKRMLRIDRAGLEDEKIYEGTDALAPADEYLSVLLLWR